MQLVFLVEEPSMKHILDAILPKILSESVSWIVIPHEGKDALRKSIPNKLKGWNIPDSKFVIVHDQDYKECRELKKELVDLCEPFHRDVLIRIPCRELEAWYSD